MRRTALVIFMWLSPLVPAVAQVTADEAAHQIAALENAQTVVTAPVEIDGNVLFRVRGVTSLPADQRSPNTDGVDVREGKVLCQTHLDGHDQVVTTGGVFRR